MLTSAPDPASYSLQAPAEPLRAVFVQSAERVEVCGERLVLGRVGAHTIYFGHGPQRVAGHMPTAEFLDLWAERVDPLTRDAICAVVDYVDGGAGASEGGRIVVILSEPKLCGDTLMYQAEVLEGTPPENPSSGFLFLDTGNQVPLADSALSAGHGLSKAT